MPVPREVGRVGGAADGGKRGAAQAARDVVVLPRAETWAVDELRLRAGAHTYVHDDMAYSAIQNKRTSEHGAAHVVLKLCMVSVFKQFWPKSSHASCMTALPLCPDIIESLALAMRIGCRVHVQLRCF